MSIGAANSIFVVENILETARFYREKLGFSSPVVSERYGVLRRDDLEIHLMPVHQEASKMNPNNAVKKTASDVYVVVTDVDQLHQEFAAQGLKITRGPETYQDVSREFVVEDLNGYWLCFSQEFKPWRD
jgi:predicted enzyme related to lactoylglutathione lyase